MSTEFDRDFIDRRDWDDDEYDDMPENWSDDLDRLWQIELNAPVVCAFGCGRLAAPGDICCGTCGSSTGLGR